MSFKIYLLNFLRLDFLVNLKIFDLKLEDEIRNIARKCSLVSFCIYLLIVCIRERLLPHINAIKCRTIFMAKVLMVGKSSRHPAWNCSIFS
jgi:hypothetical protein